MIRIRRIASIAVALVAVGIKANLLAVPPKPRCAIECDFGPAFEWLARSPSESTSGWTATSGMQRACGAIAFLHSSDAETVRREIRGEVPSRLRFTELLGSPQRERARRVLRAAFDAVTTRRDLIERRVSSLLPDSVSGVALPVVFVVGMPSGFTSQSFDDGGRRALLVDVIGFAELVGIDRPDLRDALGEELALALAPELFLAVHAEFESARDRGLPRDDLEWMQRELLVQGIADHLGRRTEERYDGDRRHAPLIDAVARDAFAALEENVIAILDPRTPEPDRRERLVSFSIGPRQERYGVLSGSFMIDAIVRFSGSRRVAGVLEAGPHDLARAYAEVCSAHAAIPRLGTRVASILASDSR